MAETKEKVEVVKHENIFEALSAFQGENPEIIQSKKVSYKEKNSERLVEYSYAPLDEILKTVRPLLAKHGLSVTFGAGKEAGMLICSLYHTTYKITGSERVSEDMEYVHRDGAHEPTASHTKFSNIESGVIRSAPIKVKRADSMKDIGSDSTYARRYMLAEVLGIASDEDKDAPLEEKAKENTEKFAFTQIETKIKEMKKVKDVEVQIEYLKKELALAQGGKTAPALGLKAEQYEKLLAIANKHVAKLNGEPIVEDTGEVSGEDLPKDLGGKK